VLQHLLRNDLHHGLLQRLFRNRLCCEPTCCDSGCTPSATSQPGQPIEAVPLPKGKKN
jgi:hypothetical protein